MPNAACGCVKVSRNTVVDKLWQTRVWDAAEHLGTDEDAVAYLDPALNEGDPALLGAVLGHPEHH
jgi:DNA-binding phage protein